MALGYSLEDTKDILWSLDFNDFLDDSWGIVRDSRRLISEYGWYKGDFFRDWIADLIAQKTGDSESTFADIEFVKDMKGFMSLYFMGTNLSTSFAEIFSAEDTPEMPIADAVRISMSIPLFFASKVNGPRGDIYVDGGVLDNYPVKLFDSKRYSESGNYSRPEYYERINSQVTGQKSLAVDYVFNKETLGFRLDEREELAVFMGHGEAAHKQIDNFFDYTWALIATLINSQQNTHLHSDDWARTVYIDTLGVGTTDFDLSDEKKVELIESGKYCANEYFNWLKQRTAGDDRLRQL